MPFRETLNQNKKLAAGVVGFLLLAGVALSAQSLFRKTPVRSEAAAKQVYFSTDDGTTFFADSATLIPPYIHEGKTAVEAFVFKGGDGKLFVGYLQQYTPEAKKRLEASQAAAAALGNTGVEVKKPGAAFKWAPLISKAGSETVSKVSSPSGQKDVSPVLP